MSGLLSLDAKRAWNVTELNSAWHAAAEACERATETLTARQKARIITFSPPRDAVIEPKHERLAGVSNRRSLGSGHMGSIVLTLLGRRGAIRRFAQQLRG